MSPTETMDAAALAAEHMAQALASGAHVDEAACCALIQGARAAGRLDQAQLIADRYFARSASPAVQSERAYNAVAGKDWEQALALLEHLAEIEAAPSDITAARLVQAYRNAGRREQARKVAAQGLARFPRSRSLYSEHAWTAAAEQDWGAAVGSLKMLGRLYKKPNKAQYFRLVEALRQSGDFVLADAYAEQARKIFLAGVACPPFSRDSSFELLENKKNAPLVICFQGFLTNLVKDYGKRHGTEDLSGLNNGSLPFAMKGFADCNAEYNYLFVKDNYQVWYLINTEAYLIAIREVIDRLAPSHVICAGVSSGGYAAIAFADALKADLAVAVSPQIVAFTNFMCAYRRHVNQRLLLGLHAWSNLAFLQRRNGAGFNASVRIYLCAAMPVDVAQVAHLHADDANLQLNYLDCMTHNPFSELGKDFLYKKMFDDIAACVQR